MSQSVSLRILLILVIFPAFQSSLQVVPQFCATDQFSSFPGEESITSLLADCVVISGSQSTVTELSWDAAEMAGLSANQKQTLKSLYKIGRKSINLESNVQFLTRSLESGFIPKSFRMKNSLPGNSALNKARINDVCKEAMNDEKQKHKKNIEEATKNLEKA